MLQHLSDSCKNSSSHFCVCCWEGNVIVSACEKLQCTHQSLVVKVGWRNYSGAMMGKFMTQSLLFCTVGRRGISHCRMYKCFLIVPNNFSSLEFFLICSIWLCFLLANISKCVKKFWAFFGLHWSQNVFCA